MSSGLISAPGTVTLQALLELAEATLQPASVMDYCPNGLQVEGRSEIRRLVTGVTASQALLDAAVQADADAVLVHHGYFWKGEDPCIRGMKRRRLATLLGHDISLVAYHLPLDIHPQLGNNARLAERLGLVVEGPLDPQARQSVGVVCRLPEAMEAAAFAQRVGAVLERQPLHIPGPQRTIHRIGLCTGAAQGYIEQAVAQGLDAYLTGEVSEPTVHVAREAGIHFIAAGHHATERYGIQALGAYLAEQLGIEHRFIDIDNPV